MRRFIKRWLVGTSLLLCIGTLLLWGRSYFTHDFVEQHRRGDLHGRKYDDIRGVFSGGGSIGVGYVRIQHPVMPGFSDEWEFASGGQPTPFPTRFRLLGFSYCNMTLPGGPQRGPAHLVGFAAPHALFAALLAIGPGIAARRFWLARRRRLRIARGLCVACGYDVRASAERCPECGAVPEEPRHKRLLRPIRRGRAANQCAWARRPSHA